MNFSEQVKKVKNEKGITNEKLSSRSGIPFSTINKILSNDAANPKLDVVIAIATALDCPISYLIDGEGEFVNQSLSEEEKSFIRDFRQLDSHGKELVSLVLSKEAERLQLKSDNQAAHSRSEASSAKILLFSDQSASGLAGASFSKTNTAVSDAHSRILPLFDLPVSAGVGVFLDSDNAEPLEIKLTKTTSQADFALRISGDSMEPTFSNGEILLVKSQESVERGELGIFIGDGKGYFKRFMGDCLRSLNPSYEDIPLSRFNSLSCCGKVIGQMPR